MRFKEWLIISEGGWFSKGKAQQSLFKPGPRDSKHKPHDVGKKCGEGGGPGPGGDCAVSGGQTPIAS